MQISAQVHNTSERHAAVVRTEGRQTTVEIAPKADGAGSAVNGGELLMLALATCYCNDLYREPARRSIVIDAICVAARAEFSGVGLAASDINYRASVSSAAAARSHRRTAATDRRRGGGAQHLACRRADRTARLGRRDLRT